MSLGILGSIPTPRIDLGPECVPGFPCSEAAEQRQILERGLTAFLNRARNPPAPMSPQNDPLLREYQDASQQLSPDYQAELTNQAATIAMMRERALSRRGDLQRSAGLRGPYYVVPAPGPFLFDAAWTGVPTRVIERW